MVDAWKMWVEGAGANLQLSSGECTLDRLPVHRGASLCSITYYWMFHKEGSAMHGVLMFCGHLFQLYAYNPALSEASRVTPSHFTIPWTWWTAGARGTGLGMICLSLLFKMVIHNFSFMLNSKAVISKEGEHAAEMLAEMDFPFLLSTCYTVDSLYCYRKCIYPLVNYSKA